MQGHKQMWTARTTQLPNGRGLAFAVDRGGRPARYLDVLHGWREDEAFRAFFNALLADMPFAEFRWETPPVTATTVTRPFEFVVLNSPGLARRPDPEAFAEHFDAANVVVFPNLGRDAVLVVPCHVADVSAYGHLAAFVRLAPEPQRHALWQAVGDAMAGRVGTNPVWLSTAGAGVSWLHVRLDDLPKYYGFAPFREVPLCDS